MVPLKVLLPYGFLDEENRDGYNISAEMKKVWAVQIDLLFELERVCKEYKLTFYAIGGTILGAVRHGGYIPWDDDIDLIMTRDDYDILCSHSDAFSFPYLLQTELTDAGSLRNHAQLRNANTTAILECEKEKKYSFNQGIFIDIFPLDYMPDDKRKREQFLKRLKRRRRFNKLFSQFCTRYSVGVYTGFKGVVLKLFSPAILSLNSKFRISEKLYISFEKEMKKYNHKDQHTIGLIFIAMDRPDRYYWNEDIIEGSPVPWKYEWFEINLPSKYEFLLENMYGNWKEFVVGGSVHGGVIFDVDKNYKEYLIKGETK